jgi:hypothetical protein
VDEYKKNKRIKLIKQTNKRRMNDKKMNHYSMPIRMYGKVELAQYYFPDVPPELARDHLSRWIRKHPALRQELRNLNMGRHLPYYTSQEVEAIFHYFGEP